MDRAALRLGQQFRGDALAQRVDEEEAFSVMWAAQVGQEGVHTRGVVEQSRAVLCEQPAQRAPREWVHR